MEAEHESIVPGVVLDGRYRVERTLGSGAMGVVVLARHLELGRTVAIKILRPELAGYASVSMRFRDEARATAAIRSEHAVRVYDVSPSTVTPPFIVMERLRGSDLEAVLQQGPFEPADAIDYVLQACAGVAAAHALGIVHRDLKPANLFLAEHESGGHVVKVLDFGIAKSILEESKLHRMTQSGTTQGTPAYMSPDQLETPGDIDVTTDVWALGVILCELVTGELPFQAANVPRLCSAILTELPRRPSVVKPGIPRELDAIVLRCLEKDRKARFPTVVALAEALAPLATRNGPERLARIRAAATASSNYTEPPPDAPPPSRQLLASAPLLVLPDPRAVVPASVPLVRRPYVWVLAGLGAVAAAVVGAALVVGLSGGDTHGASPVTSAAPPPALAPAEVPVTAPAAVVAGPDRPATSASTEPAVLAPVESAAPPHSTQAPVPSGRPSHAPATRPAGAGPAAAHTSQDDRDFGGRK
ncbi:MAG TPA: serine/threonine-protein kinase [Polyangiaceae bacterium]